MKSNFGERLKALRIENNVPQREIAELLFISSSAISHLEVGKATTDAKALVKLSKYFDVSTDYLLGLTDYKRFDLDNILDEFGRKVISRCQNLTDIEKDVVLGWISDYLLKHNKLKGD